jgi:cbb3-type cytochrome oxidase maturation protein
VSVIIILLIVSLTVAVCFLVAYIWSIKSGQFDDDFSPAHRIFFDEEKNTEDNIKY